MKAAPALKFALCPLHKGLPAVNNFAGRAGRAVAGGVFVSPAGLKLCDDFRPMPMNKMNLTRREICRGKISLQKNQPTSKKGRHQRQINE
jgi:hypothetical protein